MENNNSKLYKIVVHSGSKNVFEFEIKSETASTISYFVGGSGTPKILSLKWLDKLDVHNLSNEVMLNPVVIYTKDQFRIEEYMDMCNDFYISLVLNELQTKMDRLEKYKKLEWKRSEYGKN